MIVTNSQGIWSRLPKCIPFKASWELAVLTDDKKETAAAAAFPAEWGVQKRVRASLA